MLLYITDVKCQWKHTGISFMSNMSMDSTYILAIEEFIRASQIQ